MIGLIDSWDVEYNGTENEALFKLVCDSAAELSSLTHYDSIKIRIGSECADIATGAKYLKSSTAWVLQPSANAWENVYTKAQVDSMYNTLYQTMLYYHTVQTSTDGTITFYAFEGFVGSLTIYGNGSQTGTPTPSAPIQLEFVGTLDNTNWTIPISCGGETTTFNIGSFQTVRKIKKQVFDGTETVRFNAKNDNRGRFAVTIPISSTGTSVPENVISTHLPTLDSVNAILLQTGICMRSNAADVVVAMTYNDVSITSPTDAATIETAVKSYLASQYANGTPVTVWYVLATPENAIVNEPLAKIGTYADILPLVDTLAPIPTVDGENTLTINTALPPSKIEISGER